MFSRKISSAEAREPATGLKSSCTSLRVNNPNDSLEQEADRVADEIMAGRTSKIAWSLSRVNVRHQVQRKCACGRLGDATGECEECKEKKNLQRKGAGSTQAGVAPPIVHEVLSSPGQPLSEDTRNVFEERFGHEFSHVRVHIDDRAAESAKAVGALAYTVGKDIVFAKSQYAPGTASGQNLLAHELTHAIQQSADTGYMGLQREIDGGELDDQDEEQQVNEPHDGDTPVNTSAAPEVAQEDVETTAGLADLELVAQTSPEPMQAGGKKAKETPKDKKGEQKKPSPPLKITSIDVDLPTQHMTVHYSDGTTEGHVIASGKGRPGTADDPCKTQTEKNCTPTGDFKIASKGHKDTKNKHGDRMAWYVELGGDEVINGRGIGIHNSQPVGGGPQSHGCVRVGDSPADEAFAKKINKGVDDSTVVHITGKAPTKPWGKKPGHQKTTKAKPEEKRK